MGLGFCLLNKHPLFDTNFLLPILVDSKTFGEIVGRGRGKELENSCMSKCTASALQYLYVKGKLALP